MHDFAQHPIDTARRWAAVLALSLAGRGQDLGPAPRFADIDALAVRALDAKDPVARGEAALWLADSGKLEHYDAILATARDNAAPARHRGILAVGRLGAPGSEAFLGKLLLDLDPDKADAAIAAFALGQIDDAVPTPSIDALLRRVQGGSQKRNLALLSALLGGLATRPHPSRATAVRRLRDDEANRAVAISLLAQTALSAAGELASRAQVGEWLTSEQPAVRGLALLAWQPEWRTTSAERDQFVRLVRSDSDPAVRAGALRLLGQMLDPAVIDLADRALMSRAPVEAAAAAKVLLALAGATRRRAVEERALDPRLAPEGQASLIDTLTSSLSPRMLLYCHDRAHDASAPATLQVACALALVRAESVLAPAALQAVFFAIEDRDGLGRVAVALRDLGQLPAMAARATTAVATAQESALAARLHAMALADPVIGTDLFLALVAGSHLRESSFGTMLAALRAARNPRTPATLLALLPPAVAALTP